MAIERSCCHLEIPKELAANLASVDAQEYGCPVWSFSKHNSGYSLKLFWKSEHFKLSPNKTHFVSLTTSSKKRNRQRMEAFWQRRRQKHLLLHYSRELMRLLQRKVLQLPPTPVTRVGQVGNRVEQEVEQVGNGAGVEQVGNRGGARGNRGGAGGNRGGAGR